MKSNLTTIATAGIDSCLGGKCPTAYVDENGRLFIQGRTVSGSTMQGLTIPKGESIVEVPESLIANLVASLNKRHG